jgi:hypothetical protein
LFDAELIGIGVVAFDGVHSHHPELLSFRSATQADSSIRSSEKQFQGHSVRRLNPAYKRLWGKSMAGRDGPPSSNVEALTGVGSILQAMRSFWLILNRSEFSGDGEIRAIFSYGLTAATGETTAR